jgi:hypothetical protein
MSENRELGFSIKIMGKDGELSKLAEIEKGLAKVKEQRKFLNDAYKRGEISSTQLAKATAELNLTTKVLNKSKADVTRTITLETKQANAQKGSYDQLSATYSLLKFKINAMTEAQRTQTAEGRKLVAQSKQVRDKMNELQQATGNSSLNVGKYSEALQGLGGVFTQFGGQMGMQLAMLARIKAALGGVVASLKAQKAAQTGANVATSAGSKVLKILRIALISTGIGAIVVVLGSLIAAFTSTQRGIDAVTRVTRPLKALFATLFGVIQNVGLKAFDGLRNVINNPIQALKNLGKAIVENVVNRFKAVAIFAGAIGKLLKGDFKEAATDIMNGTTQMITGVTNLTNKMKKSGSEMSATINSALENGKKLDAFQKKIERAEIELTKNQQKRQTEFQRLRELSNDMTKSDAERISFMAQAQAKQNEIAGKEIGLIDLKIGKMKLEQSLNDTSNADLLELAGLERDREAALTTATKKRSSLEATKTAIVLRGQVAAEKASEKAIATAEKEYKKLLSLAQQLRDGEVKAMEESRNKKVEILDNELSDKESALRAQLGNDKAQNVLINSQIEQLRAQHRANLTAIDVAEDDRVRKLRAKELQQLETLEELSVRNRVVNKEITVEQGEKDILAIRLKYLKQRLALIDTETNEGKIKYQKLVNEIDKINAGDDETKTGIADLFNISNDEAELLKQKALGLATEIANTIANINQTKRDNEVQAEIDANKKTKESAIAQLDKQLKAGAISQEIYNARKSEIERDADQQKEQIERAAFERNKKASKAQAAMAGALAILRIAADVPKVDFGITTAILIAAQIASTAAQIAAISAQEFALGGLVSGQRVGAANIPEKKNGDNVLATLRTGEVVLNRRQQMALGGDATFRAIGVRGFEGGGRVMDFFTPFAPSPIVNTQQLNANVTANMSAEQLAYVVSKIDDKINTLRVSAVEMTDEQNTIKAIEAAAKW